MNSRIGTNRGVRASALLLAATVGLAGCAAAESDGTTSASAPSAKGCGTLPTKAPNDPDGVLKALGPVAQDSYNGFDEKLVASPWKDWKPSGPGPYKVAIVYSTTSVPYQKTLLDQVTADLKKSNLVASVETTTYEVDPAVAVQNFQSAISSKPDIILYQPLGADAVAPLVDKAAKAGIPSISIQATVPTPNSVNITPNPYLLGARPTAELVKIMGGKGNLLGVHGVPGIPIETQTFEGIKAVVAGCSGITFDDSVVGQYNPAVAKTEVSKYLTTHPAKVDGVVHAAIMGPGILSAFEQSGREVPPIADVAATEGVIAYWKAHESSYKATGSGQGAAGIGAVVADVTLRMLGGDGPEINSIVLAPPLITAKNLDDWAVGTDTTSAASLEPPAGTYPTPGLIDAIFGDSK